MTQMTDEERAYYERTRRSIIKVPQSRIGRIGCGIALIGWFALLLMPCALFYMASAGQITLHHANIPEPDSHPLVQVQLVMEPRNRGFSVTSSQPISTSDNAMCVQTEVRYLLWQSEADRSQNVTFCDCYERSSTEAEWSFTERVEGTCSTE